MAETVTATGYRKSRDRGEADPCDDEGEFTDLREAHSGPDRGADPVPCEKAADRDPDDLAAHDQEREQDDGDPVAGHKEWVDQHPHGDEEHRSEHVAQRLDEPLDVLPRSRFRDQCTADEGTQRDRIPEAVGQQRGGEADPDAGYERRLRAVHPDDGAYQAGNNQHSEDQETGEKREEAPARPRKFPRRDGAAGRNGRKDRQQ
jgi:hypothetical protein